MLKDYEEGFALVMVLIMMSVVGILSVVMLKSVSTHMNVAVHEEGMSQAFHSAEAGVEYVKANKDNIINKIKNSDNGEKIYNSSDILSTGNMDKINFNIYIENKEEKKLKSVGSFKGYEKKITFELKFSENIKTANIKYKTGNGDDHYNISGGEEELKKYISVSKQWEEKESFVEYAKLFIDEKFFTDDKFNKMKFNYSLGEGDEIEGNYTNETIFVDGNTKINQRSTIEDSIIVVNGAITDVKNKVEINDSVIIIKDYFELKGASASEEWNNPIWFIYSEEYTKHDNKNIYMNIAGGGRFTLIPEDLPEDFKKELDVSNWQQQ